MNTAMESSIQIEERAAAWLTQRDSGNWTEADERALQAWLAASTAHEVAFVRLEAVWHAADRLNALGSGLAPGDVPPPETWHLPPAKSPAEPTSRPPPARSRLALAACVAFVLTSAGAGAWYLLTKPVIFRTAVGGLASVPMEDGSRITLNTDSEVRLIGAERERRVDLERGEAFFEVTKDPDRPFVVHAGRQRIFVLGTRFSVRRSGDELRILVTEGRVRVEPESSRARAWRPAELTAGSIATCGPEGLSVTREPVHRVEEYLAWRSGYIVFDETPLSEAVAEFNRYNRHQLVIADPAIADIAVSGRFRTQNFEAFVRLVQSGFPVRAQAASGAIVLTRAE